MNAADFLLIIAIALALGLAARKCVVSHKNGDSCGGSCDGCGCDCAKRRK